jgi:hypothetical protein
MRGISTVGGGSVVNSGSSTMWLFEIIDISRRVKKRREKRGEERGKEKKKRRGEEKKGGRRWEERERKVEKSERLFCAYPPVSKTESLEK